MDSPKPAGSKPQDKLPYSKWWPFAVGAATGIALRLLFWGQPGGAYTAMTSGFIYFSPAIVGAVTVYVAERYERRTWNYYIGASAVANLLFVIGTMLVLIEGLICAVIILPLFIVLGAIGGLIMGAICRFTNWPKKALYGLGVLPLILGGIDPQIPLSERRDAVERSILIHAAPDEIWRQIMHVPSIDPHEIEHAWLFRIGVPLTKSGVLRQERVRRVTMGKNIYFDEVIMDSQENRYLRWAFRYHDDSFPRYALDEHVVLGGHYFDIGETTYTLTPRGPNTELTVRMAYRVSTRFNWYADPVAAFLLGNLAEINLGYYRGRSEAAQPPK